MGTCGAPSTPVFSPAARATDSKPVRGIGWPLLLLLVPVQVGSWAWSRSGSGLAACGSLAGLFRPAAAREEGGGRRVFNRYLVRVVEGQGTFWHGLCLVSAFCVQWRVLDVVGTQSGRKNLRVYEQDV